MSSIFITGDRSLHPVLAVNALFALFEARKIVLPDPEAKVMTGSAPTGVEAAVRYLLPQVSEVTYSVSDEGKVDFDSAFKILDADPELKQVYFIHTDPGSSSVGLSLMQHITGDKLVIL